MNRKLEIYIVVTFLSIASFLFFGKSSSAQACTLRTANWSTNSSTVGSTVNLVVGGDADCMGQSVEMKIWERDPGLDDEIVTLNARFNAPGISVGATAVISWRIDGSRDDDVRSPPYGTNYEFYFVARSQTSSVRTSNTLIVPIPVRGGVGQQPPVVGQQPGQSVSVSFNIENPIQSESLIDLAKAIGRFLFQIAIPIAVIVIIYSGILFLTSGGNKEKITKARQALWYAIIGLAIILIGQGFFTLIKSILNLGG